MKRLFMALSALSLVSGIAVAATSGAVDRVLGEDAIKALTSGKTFHYIMQGQSRGSERHFEDGRVVWRLANGECMHGTWAVSSQMMCYYYGAFRYGCWNVVEGPDGLRHRPLNLDGSQGGGPSVYINRISEESIGCTPQQLSLLSR